jgi:hypothetical protein
MKSKGLVRLSALAIIVGFFGVLSACQDNTSGVTIEESLDVVPNLSLVSGAENTTIRVNRGTNSYFNIDVSNIEYSNMISEGPREAWCIAYNTPISSDNSIYEGLGVYSTKGDKRFSSINRLFTVKDRLMKNDPDITWKEIQVAIWSLMEYPKFDMYSSDLPNRLRTNGQPNFNTEKVESIVAQVKSSGTSQLRSSLTSNNQGDDSDQEKEVCVIVTDGDTQTIITECDDTFWAFGTIHNFRADGNGQWGWVLGTETDDLPTPLIRGAGLDDGTVTDPTVFINNWIGYLSVEESNGNLNITYDSDNGFLMNDIHLWVGCDYNDELPTAGNSTNVPPGRLPYKYEADDAFSSHTFEVDVSGLNCSEGEYQIAAHGNAYWSDDEVL